MNKSEKEVEGKKYGQYSRQRNKHNGHSLPQAFNAIA